MQIDPAKKLKQYQERTKRSPIWDKLGNFLYTLLFAIILFGIIFLMKDFTLLWMRVLIETIKGNF